jgi:EAL and modified HD-GYP domain-containing signal transduction protein
MFSLLDQFFFGVPVQDVLKQITLPEAMAQALLTRGGVYGPFLALAEACEREHDSVSELADALFMTASHQTARICRHSRGLSPSSFSVPAFAVAFLQQPLADEQHEKIGHQCRMTGLVLNRTGKEPKSGLF